MIRLIIKIFLAYWLAAGLVIISVNVGPHQHMHNPELTDALNASLERESQRAVQDLQSTGCSEAINHNAGAESSVAIAAADGTLLCGSSAIDPKDAQWLASAAARSEKMTVLSYRKSQLIAFPTPGNPRYIFLLSTPYRTPTQLFGLQPGNITFFLSIVITIFMALLVALPIKRLRAMAREIALGRREARVRPGFMSRHFPQWGAGDDLDGLAIDFNEMAKRIEELVNSQRLLLRDVSHELRSPLARAGLALQLAKSKSMEPAQVYLDRIEFETEKLNDLISQLMELSYMEMINGVSHTDEIALSLVVLDLLPDLQFEAAAKGCHVTAGIRSACRTRGDRALLHRALENVARNAIRYTPSGGFVRIDLHAEESTRQAVLKVSDSGPGVPEAELEAIRKPFYRVDQSRQSSSGGFGIGLAIADRAVQLHNGELRVSNGRSGGLVVEMRIPAIGLES